MGVGPEANDFNQEQVVCVFLSNYTLCGFSGVRLSEIVSGMWSWRSVPKLVRLSLWGQRNNFGGECLRMWSGC